MAVSKRTYHVYDGALSPAWSRFLVVTHFALGQLFQSKLFVAMFALCAVPFLIGVAAVYLTNSSTARLVLNLNNVRAFQLDARFFLGWLQFVGWLAAFMAAYVGPNLVSPDLMHNALPLYLSRPISRTEYVLGKAAVLAVLLSAITWVPGLLLYFMQVGMSDAAWFRDYWWVGGAIVLASLVWIALLTLVSLAISAWVRWRIVATAFTFAFFLLPTAMGQIINIVLQTRWGSLLDIIYLNNRVWGALFRQETTAARGLLTGLQPLPLPLVWGMLAALCALSIWMLNQRLRAREVVRG